MATENENRALIRKNIGKPVRFRWPPCETCGHGRICHHPDKGGGWRCRFKKKRNGSPCDCMRYRGELQVIPL